MGFTLDTSHFEMSELNATAVLNTAESKKKKERERRQKKRSEKILEKKQKKKWGERGGERGRYEKEKNEMKRTIFHVRHFGHLPF